MLCSPGRPRYGCTANPEEGQTDAQAEARGHYAGKDCFENLYMNDFI